MLFKFTCFPNGLAFCPRKFTKLMKPVFATLRQLAHYELCCCFVSRDHGVWRGIPQYSISHFLSRISHFYIASRIFFISHLAFLSRISHFYLACRIFISHFAFFISHLAFFISHLAFFISHLAFLYRISHFFISHLAFLSRISHFLSRISHFYLASRIFYLASCIFYLASCIFLSRIKL